MENNSLFIDIGHQLRKVDLNDVLHMHYVEGATTIEMLNKNNLICCTTLIELQQHLPANFIRINRNVIINIQHMVAYYKQSQVVNMMDGRSFTVSRRSVSHLMRQMKKQFPLLK